MQISDNLTIRPTGPSGLLAAQTSTWQVGEILSATVAEALGSGQVSMRINGQLFTAQTSLTVKPGATLTLRVVSVGEQPTLAVAPSTAEQDPQTQAWRVVLPLQEPLQPLLDVVAALANDTAESTATPAQVVFRIAEQILTSLPDVQEVARPAGLKTAVLNSGLFLESRLLAAANESGSAAGISVADFKAGLLRLTSALRESTTDPAAAGSEFGGSALPPARGDAVPARGSMQAAPLVQNSLPSVSNTSLLVQSSITTKPPGQNSVSASPPLQLPPDLTGKAPVHQVEAALARLQMNQLSSLPAEHGGTPMWVIDLPVRREDRVDVLRLQVEADDRRGHSQELRSWSVSLGLEPSNLGPVHVRLTLHGGQISATVWAERPDTAALFAIHLEELRAGMTQAGLAVGAMGCYCGKAPASAHVRMPEKLLDTRA